jgi:methanol metabolism-related c-type cytochrome
MRRAVAVLLFTLGAAAITSTAIAVPAPPKEEDGKYFDSAGDPTYKIGPDGTVDWYTFSGYRRFNGSCEVCHGFGGAGSSFAPDLTSSLKDMTYEDFQKTVINGKQDVNTAQSLVMPAFGEDKNVMCYLDDIYVYLKARATGGLGGARPANNEAKPETATKAENDCMGPG